MQFAFEYLINVFKTFLGESVAASVQITDVFNIDTDGLYTVQYSKPLQYLSVDEMSVMSNGEVRESTVHESTYIYLENTHLLLKPIKPEEMDKVDYTVHLQACGSASFKGPYNKNDETLVAHKKLCAGIDKAKGKVGNTTEYKTWFGTYTTARADKVKTVYQKMKDGISGKTVTYYNYGMHCKSNWYMHIHTMDQPLSTFALFSTVIRSLVLVMSILKNPL